MAASVLGIRGIALAARAFTGATGVECPPGRNYCRRGIPSGWSRDAPIAERRPHTGQARPRERRARGGVVISAPTARPDLRYKRRG
jgi:hypothetical protein